ncbi:MAG: ABC transporter permease [Treponema sp.]|jgi:peptide/nickel transport system permease protein|nr:ABC transporter permease [Treponema sp.]
MAAPRPVVIAAAKGRGLNRRVTISIVAAVIFVLLLSVNIAGFFMDEARLLADFSQKALPPSPAHPFGTDLLGRDMFARTVKGLSLSLVVGVVASSVSALIALVVGVAAALGREWLDHLINWFIDLTMSIPHTVLLILISIALGRGLQGLLAGIAVTHWTGLARIIRGEVLQVRSRQFIKVSRSLGHSGLWITCRHIVPHVIPQFFIGLVLMFPHSIMHEAGLTFLGFGLPPEQPAIGIILSEAMRYLSGGMWWQAFFPGLALVIMVLLIDKLGECLKMLLDPYSAQE